LIEELPYEARFVLGDTHYNAKNVRRACLAREMFLVASGRRGPYPHTEAGVEVRRILHRPRHVAIENLNEHFKAIFEAHGPVPQPREDSTPHASPWERSSSTNWRCSTGTSGLRARTVDSKPSSELLE
jgi:hypothetical protein